MTDEEFMGASSGQGMTEEEFLAAKPAASSSQQRTKAKNPPFSAFAPLGPVAPLLAAGTEAGMALGQQGANAVRSWPDLGRDALGVTAAAGDMILGAPARLAGKVMNVGTRGVAAAQGESRKVQGQAGQLAENLGPLESLKNPLGYMAQLFTGATPPEPGVVEHAMEAMNAGISKYTGGLLTPQDAAMLTETAMDILGVKTVKPMAQAMKKAPPRGIENQRTPGIIEGEVLPRAEAAVDASQARIARGRTIEGEVVPERGALPKQAGAAKPEMLAALGLGTGAAILGYNELRDAEGNFDPSKLAGPVALGIFLPSGAKHANTLKAEMLEKRGVSRDTIWHETGSFRGADGRWYREIPDDAATLNPDLPRNPYDSRLVHPADMFKPKELKDVLNHPALFKAKPDLAGLSVKSTGFNFGLKGAYDEAADTMYLAGGKPEEVRSTALHELQHAVQKDHNMPRGGSPEQFLPEGFSEAAKTVREKMNTIEKNFAQLPGTPNFFTIRGGLKDLAEGKPLMEYQKKHMEKVPEEQLQEYADLLKDYEGIQGVEARAYEGYKSLAGEVEARTVQSRMNMTAAERRKTPPWESWDVPEKDWITQFTVGKAGAQAVKPPGGMWHPEAVKRLSDPLGSRLVTPRGWDQVNGPERVQTAAISDGQKWSDKAVSRYLNKYAGTEGDPLKDVEVPFRNMMDDGAGGVFQRGRDTARWEELMDVVIDKAPAKYFSDIKGAPLEEPVHTLETQIPNTMRSETRAKADTRIASGRALTSYLSHVGDYLRENVPADKLPQYDLVRAVKETAENDAKIAAKSAKQWTEANPWALKHMESMPVYKEYPSISFPAREIEINKLGSKQQMTKIKVPAETVDLTWRELKLPEKLTPEQMKTVVKGTDGASAYFAVDAQGKKIINNFTDEPARGKTPEEAWLAGRLAEEGNQLGHCVGGYCSEVAAGDSKIYSLRDSKGRSHATVEVRPEDFRRVQEGLVDYYNTLTPEQKAALPNAQTAPATWRRDIMELPSWKEYAKRFPGDIVQIKGKQNQAPAAEYLPYVQDFVKKGKWGEVGDLGNAGLLKYKDALLTPEEGLQLLKEKGVGAANLKEGSASRQRLEAGDPVTIQAMLESADHNRGPASQRGSIDPDLVKALAATGVGAAAGAAFDASSGDDSVLNGAVIGAAAGLGLSSKWGKEVRKGGDYLIGNLSTRLAEIAPPLRRAARDMELEVHQGIKQAFDKVSPFLNAMKALPKEARESLNLALLRNNLDEITAATKGNPALVDGYRQVRNFLATIEEQSKALGRFKEGLVEYFPRTVKDFDGLKAALDLESRKGLDSLLFEAEAASMRTRKRPLTPVEQSLIVNRFLTSPGSNSFLPGYARVRGVKDLTAELQQFYDTPADSLIKYITASVSDAAQARFFGKDIKVKADGGRKFTDVDESIGAVAQKLLESKQISLEQADQLKKLLTARFVGGEKAMTGPLQDVRNLNNMGLLGSLDSAATQIADSVFQIYHQSKDLNPLYYIESVARTITGKGISPKDFGLANHISEELSSTRATGKALGLVFKPFFAPIDQFGKGVALTGPYLRMKELVKTDAGIEKLREKWGADYGKDFPQLVEDLKSATLDKRSDLVDSVLWQELSNTQPISMLENSQHYNENPNGRLLHNMKTFTEKQIDVVRRDAYNEIASGESKQVVRGLKNLGLMATVLTFSNIPGDEVKAWLSGVPLKIDEEYLLGNILKNFGINKYSTDQVGSGKIKDAAIGVVAPPTGMWADIFNAARDSSERNVKKLVKYFPWIGKTVYNQELGGKEEAALREQTKNKKEEKEEKTTPERKEKKQDIKDKKKEKAAERAWQRSAFEDSRGLMYSDTPANDGIVYDGITQDPPLRVVRNKRDFYRQRMNEAGQYATVEANDERRALINEAKKKFGRSGERTAMKLLMERELRQPKRGRVQA